MAVLECNVTKETVIFFRDEITFWTFTAGIILAVNTNTTYQLQTTFFIDRFVALKTMGAEVNCTT